MLQEVSPSVSGDVIAAFRTPCMVSLFHIRARWATEMKHSPDQTPPMQHERRQRNTGPPVRRYLSRTLRVTWPDARTPLAPGRKKNFLAVHIL